MSLSVIASSCQILKPRNPQLMTLLVNDFPPELQDLSRLTVVNPGTRTQSPGFHVRSEAGIPRREALPHADKKT
jgi:hypothetical protein